MTYIKPHVRDFAFWGGASPGTQTVDVKAGDFVVAYIRSANNSTARWYTAGLQDAVIPKWAIVTASQDGRSALVMGRAGEDYTAQLGTTSHLGSNFIYSSQTGNTAYGISAAIWCFDNVEAFQWARTGESPLTGTIASPTTVVTHPTVRTTASAAAAATSILIVGGAGYTSASSVAPMTYTPATDLLCSHDAPTTAKHTVLQLDTADPSLYDLVAGQEFTQNGTSGRAPLGVALLVCSEVADDPEPSFHPLTMGDGTPVTLEGYWDGTQLLPAEFVGLAST